jgi:hypothetical protein
VSPLTSTSAKAVVRRALSVIVPAQPPAGFRYTLGATTTVSPLAAMEKPVSPSELAASLAFSWSAPAQPPGGSTKT